MLAAEDTIPKDVDPAASPGSQSGRVEAASIA
jgi:hypothetical protein